MLRKIKNNAARRERLRRLREEQNHRCCYCGVRFVDEGGRTDQHRASIDEVVPYSLGGEEAWENQVAACAGCNSAKSGMNAYAFLASRVVARRRGIARVRNRLPPHELHRARVRVVLVAETVETSLGRSAYFQMVYGVSVDDGSPQSRKRPSS